MEGLGTREIINLNSNQLTNTMEDAGLVGDNFLRFFDENSSVVFKGVIDQNGSFLLDPSQFVNILLDQSQSHPQNSIETANGMTIQMISMPPPFPMGGKCILNDRLDTSDTRSTFQLRTETGTNPIICDTSGNSIQFDLNPVRSASKKFPPAGLQILPSGSPLVSGCQQASLDLSGTQVKKQRTKAIPVRISDPILEPPIGKAPYVCSVCLKSFQSFQQYRKHKSEHLNDKHFRCHDCTMQFNFEINLKLHEMFHEAEQSGNLQCQLCSAKFSRLASLKSHLRVHEKEENLVCNECGEEVPTVARLNEHMDVHRTRFQQCMVYRCKLCGKPFNSQALLRDHSKEHIAVRKELKIFARQKPRKSKKKASSDSSNWNSSSKASQKKKRVCTVCSKAFDKPSQLDRHFRIHSGEKPFKCTYPDCNKSFNQKVTLDSHVLACHQGLKPFKCHLCSLCFSQRGNLKSHIIKVHIPSGANERVFKCEECACVYRRLATLNNHIARVHAVASTDIPFHSRDITIDTGETSTQINHNSNSVIPNLPSLPVHEAITMTLSDQTNEHQQCQLLASTTDNQEATKNLGTFLPPVIEIESTVHEVNCVYDDSQGTSKRCLLKVKRIGQKKYHLCPICPKSFRKPSDLIRHIRVHTLERPYMCGICSKSFAVKSTLNTHMKIHDPFKQLSCSVCQKKFSVLSSLKSHERLHTGAKPFQCMQCGKQFRTSSQRRVHLKTHTRNALGLTGRRKLLRIGDIKSNIDLPDPLKITSDGLVPVPNRAIKTLVSGALVDQRTRPYRCTQTDCIASFKKSSHLKQHLRSHTGERPYKCLQCHRNFISSGVLKNHIKTHEGVRAFTCKVCSFAFTTNGSLTRHMATHMDERLYVCPYCAKTFKTSVATRKHIKVHRDEIIPFHSSVTDAENTQNGIMLNDQCQQTLHGVPNQFRNDQDYDTTGLVALYENEFSDVNDVITEDIQMPRIEKEEHHVGIGNTQVSLQSSDNQMNSLVPVPCHGSEIIHNSDGTVTLQYTLPEATMNTQQNSSDNMELGLGQDTNFDSTLYALQQGGETLDLQFLQDSQEMRNETHNCLNEMGPYEFLVPPSLSESTTSVAERKLKITVTESNEETPISDPRRHLRNSNEQTSHKLTSPPKKAKATKVKTKESIEVKRIREASKPISEQLYTELTTQPYQRRPKERATLPPLRSRFPGDKQNECSICHTRFKKKSDMERHMRIHTGEKPYRCSLCGKSFRVKSTRQAHMRTHEEKKKTVSCHVCHNLFSTKSSLRVHLRLHLDLKPYQCPYPNCTRNFRTSGHRKSHIQSHFKQSKELAAVAAAATASGLHSSGKQDFLQHQPSNQTIITQLLPPVETIKEIQTPNHQEQLNLTGLHVMNEINNPSAETSDNIHVLSGVQLQLDGLQFASLDLSSLQVDESFLQNVTNVIFLPSTSQGTSTDLVSAATNMVIGMLPTQELNSTDLITGKDVTLSLNLLGTPGLTDQLTSGQLTLSDNSIHQYINSNEMMSSTARVSSSLQDQQQHNYILSTPNDLVCQTCHLPFTKKQQLQKHEKTHVTTEKPFKCSLCSRRFAQKTSLDAHAHVHSQEKKQFTCPLCPFATQRKQNFKIHFTRAHPDNWAKFDETVGNGAKVPVSS